MCFGKSGLESYGVWRMGTDLLRFGNELLLDAHDKKRFGALAVFLTKRSGLAVVEDAVGEMVHFGFDDLVPIGLSPLQSF